MDPVEIMTAIHIKRDAVERSLEKSVAIPGCLNENISFFEFSSI
jgi:hypothetical protein